MTETLQERVALVTGASRGLGAAIARTLAAAGARVAINYAHSAADAHGVSDEIHNAGGKAIFVQADVRDGNQICSMVTQIEDIWGPVEILVNNATGPQPMLPLEQYTWQDYQDQLDFFVKAPFLLMQAVIGKMKVAHRGRVIHIGSEVVDLGNANFSAYVAAKGAMVGLTRAWAREFGPWGITVNLVAPGWIPVERHKSVDPAELQTYAAGVPLQRQGIPLDVAEAVAFLASDGAGFITGQCLSVNGGNTF